MVWRDDQYIRTVLDGREKWGTVLSLSAVAGLFLFLAEHCHHGWLDYSTVVVGFLGSFYVIVVNCYYEQAEAVSKALEHDGESDAQRIKDRWALSFCRDIGILGWMNNVAPFALGVFATVALSAGLPSSNCVSV